MHVVEHIFKALGGATAIAVGVGSPVQTVHDWKKKGKPEIPPWRRPAVLDLARRLGKFDELSADAIAYLGSAERPARVSQADAA